MGTPIFDRGKFQNFRITACLYFELMFSRSQNRLDIGSVYFVIRSSCDVIIVTPKSVQNDRKGRLHTGHIINFWTLSPIFFKART